MEAAETDPKPAPQTLPDVGPNYCCAEWQLATCPDCERCRCCCRCSPGEG